MRPGDKFSLKEWIDSQGNPSSNGRMTIAIEEAFDRLVGLCTQAGVPVTAAFATDQGIRAMGHLLDKPENVPGPMLMARAIEIGDPHHLMQVAGAQMQGGMKL